MTKHEGIELEAYWQCNHQFTALDSCKYFGKRLQEEQYSSKKTRFSHPNAPPKMRFLAKSRLKMVILTPYFDTDMIIQLPWSNLTLQGTFDQESGV